MRTFDVVIPYLKASWKKLAVGMLVLVAVDAIQVFIPYIIKNTIDSFSSDFKQSDIIIPALQIVALAFGIVGMRYVWRMLIIGNSHDMEQKLRSQFYRHLMKLSQSYFNFSKIGDLMALATNDLTAVRMLFGMGFIAGADIFLMMTASFIFMIGINLKLTMLAIIPMPLLSFMIGYFGRKLHKRFAVVQESFARLSGMIQESISGIRIVKAFAQETPELQKMQGYSDVFVKQNIKMAWLSGLFHPFNGVIISSSMIIVLVFGGQAVIKGDITIGGFIAFFSYLGMLTWPMIAIGWVVDMYQRGSASLGRLNEIWATEPEIIDDENTDHNITALEGKVEMRDVTFGYNEENGDILQNVSFTIESGRTMGICGKTGTGKSTMIDLLCRVYNPPKDSVFIDGHEIYSIPLELLRGSVVMVPQDIFLFSDSIANNIALGRPEASIEEIHEAARMAAVYDDIMEFHHGFETVVGERGVTVSGGQKQRIAIARALLADPKVLILDDSLSAVDTKTERAILDNFLHLRRNKTNIIVAHRISALQNADQIVVLDGKTLAECGTHEELLAKGGIYKELYEKQKIEERIEESR